MAACFRCRIRKLSCSSDSPTCKQCRLAVTRCKYEKRNRHKGDIQHFEGIRGPPNPASHDYSLMSSEDDDMTDETGFEDTAIDAGNSPSRLSEHSHLPNCQGAVFPSIEDPQAEQSEQTSTTVDILKILRFPLAANATLYNSNCVDLRDTPPVEIEKVNLQFSPSPPLAVPLPQFSPDSSLEPAESGSHYGKSKVFSNWTTCLLLSWVHQLLWRSTSQLLRPNRPSQGDGVMVSFIGNGRNPDIARIAALEPLASDAEKHPVAKGGFMLVARLLKKMALKIGLAGWRKGMKKEMEYEIEDKAEKGFEEGFVELTEEAMNVLIEHGFEDKIEYGVEHDVGKRLEKGINEDTWKESTKLWRVVLRKELRKVLKKELRRLLRKELRKVLKKELRALLRKEVRKEVRKEARKEARKITLRG